VSAKRKESETDERGGLMSLLGNRGGRWLAVAALIVLVSGGVALAVWNQVREHVLGSSQYQVDPAEIRITPVPAWIRTDIRAEVIREASFNGPLSLLDKELTIRVASAFAAHPWIAHVERVSKRFPAGLDVIVTYRKPVAMVEVPEGALPVDVEGVVLPTADFKPGEADLFPRIGEIHTPPAGLVGTRWADPALVGAAQVAAALHDDWQSLGLFRITPAGKRPGGRGGVEYAFAVFTRNGTRIDWGLAPGTTAANEPPAVEKVARLKRFAAQKGSLDGESPHQLSFSAVGDLVATPKQPLKPLPERE
jgi:hypothetical protein